MRIELLWFKGCPNHERAEAMLREVMREMGIDEPIARGRQVCFPGSPTIRIDGNDVEPHWEPCADCTPAAACTSQKRASAGCQSGAGSLTR